MFRKLLSIVLILTFCLLPLSALAQQPSTPPAPKQDAVALPDPPTPQPGEPDVGPAISPMKWGQKAPFTGILLSPKAVAIVMTELNSIEERIQIEVDRGVATCQANCNFKVEQVKISMDADIKILKAQLEARKKENEILTERLEDAEDGINPIWWAGGGFLVGALTTILIVWGSTQAAK